MKFLVVVTTPSIYQILLIPFFSVIFVNVTPTIFFLHVMHTIFSLLPSAGGLVVIFLPSELHLEALNKFSWVLPSWYCVHVFRVLSLHTDCFYLAFLLVYWCTIISLFFQIFWLLQVFIIIFVVYAVTTDVFLFLVRSVMVLPIRPFGLSDGYSSCSSWSYDISSMFLYSSQFSVMWLSYVFPWV